MASSIKCALITIFLSIFIKFVAASSAGSGESVLTLAFHRINLKSLLKADWSTYGFDLQRTGLNPTETKLTADNVVNLRRVWKLPLAATTVNQAVVALSYQVVYSNNLPTLSPTAIPSASRSPTAASTISHQFDFLRGKCLSASDNSFLYTSCFFHNVTQGSQQNKDEYFIGNFGNQVNANSFAITGGDYCGVIGADRSGLVILKCGSSVSSVTVESPTCYYTLTFTSPAYCSSPSLSPTKGKPSAMPTSLCPSTNPAVIPTLTKSTAPTARPVAPTARPTTPHPTAAPSFKPTSAKPVTGKPSTAKPVRFPTYIPTFAFPSKSPKLAVSIAKTRNHGKGNFFKIRSCANIHYFCHQWRRQQGR